MEIEPFLLLQRYRRDRRKLLEFVISKNLTRDSFDFSAVDLDAVCVDYVLECLQSGEGFDFSEATKRYFDEWDYPIMINSSEDSFFLLSTPELSGSPPRRAAPEISVLVTSNHSFITEQTPHLVDREIEKSGSEIIARDFVENFVPCQLVKDANMLNLGLPALSTGLSDDDMQETAYEVLLASVISSGILMPPLEERKEEKKTKYVVGLRSMKDGSSLREQSEDEYLDLLDVIRGQMEISETVDACIRQGLRNLRSDMVDDQTDVPQVSLELLSSISKSDFPNQRSYTQWLKRQANILEELLPGSNDFAADEHMVLSMLLSQLKNVEEWINAGPDGHAEILRCMKGFASRISSCPPKFGIPNESYYWTHSYHFNIRLYEKLLCSVFDVLEDGQIIEEAEKILKILKLTWAILGITQTMHDALYSWLFFQQFVSSGEHALLKYAIFQMQKVLSSKDDRGTEQSYMSTLVCSIEVFGSYRDLKLVETILLNIFAWCSSQLEDYHLHFGQVFDTFGSVLTMAILSGSCFADEYGGIMFQSIKSIAGVEAPFKLVHVFIESSIQSAYRRVLNFLEATSKSQQKHPLTILANELRSIAEKEFSSFSPVLCQWYPEAGEISAILLHQIYGKQLNPFLKGVVDLSESVRSVLGASDNLELYLVDVLNSVCGDSMKSPIIKNIHPYQIREVSAPLILHWVNAQHDNILEWTNRAIQIEDWEPLSSQQRQATSIIEVFRIIEETIDQFFDINLPMDIIHLRSLLIGIFRCLDAYLLHIVNQQVDKSVLYPSPPALTRYEESSNPFVKKRSAEGIVLEEKVTDQLNHLTVSKLCVKLNTLLYIREQLDALEDAIQQSWAAAQSGISLGMEEMEETEDLPLRRIRVTERHPSPSLPPLRIMGIQSPALRVRSPFIISTADEMRQIQRIRQEEWARAMSEQATRLDPNLSTVGLGPRGGQDEAPTVMALEAPSVDTPRVEIILGLTSIEETLVKEPSLDYDDSESKRPNVLGTFTPVLDILVKRLIFREIMREPSVPSEVVDELFTIFDDIRRSAVDASNIIFDFIGTRVIFWDMRDSFLSSLYRGSVESARLEKVVSQLDEVLDDICDLITDTLRDRVVLSICQASMNGYVWTILDGGPSRAFSEADVTMMQEDLNILKDFFVADGQGLPLFEVEKESGLAQQILDLYAMKVDTLIEMLRSASEHISYRPDHNRPGNRSTKDADTLLRVLCHKKDNDASKFLKFHYQLPRSSDYEDSLGVEPQPTAISPLLSEMLKRNVSFNWTQTGQKSFNLMKKKFQEATSTPK